MSTSKKLKTKTLRECGICGKKLKNPKSKVHLKSVYHKKKLAYSRGGKYIKEFENEEAKKRFLKLYNEGRRIGAKLYYGKGNYIELEKLMRESINWHRLNAMKEYNSNNNNVPLLVSNVVEVDLQDEMKDLFGEDEGEDEYWDNDDQIYQEEEGDLGMGFGINEDNNKCHEGGISYGNHDKLLEDYREMMLRKKLRLALPPKRGYEPPTWIPKHIWVQRVERMNFFREDINKSKDDVKECVIRKFPERDYSKKKDNFECEYCDIEFNNNKDFYDHCQLLSHQYNAGICVIKRNNKKIESLSREYKPEELGKNGKPKKAYRESRKKFKVCYIL